MNVDMLLGSEPNGIRNQGKNPFFYFFIFFILFIFLSVKCLEGHCNGTIKRGEG